MTDKQKDEQNDKQEISPIVAAVAGVVAFKDKKNREKVKKAFTGVKDQAINYMEEINKKSNPKPELVKTKHNFTKKEKNLKTISKKSNLSKTTKKLLN